MKQKTGIIGLVSGRLIKTRAKTGEKVTRSQSAKQALSAIIKKYGSIQDNVKYLHKGKGNWVKYSLANDRKRTGKVTSSLKEWRRQPHKLDYKGIDTKGAGKKEVKTKTKPFNLSAASLKNTDTLAGRKAKTGMKAKHVAITKKIEKPKKKTNLASAKALSMLGGKKPIKGRDTKKLQNKRHVTVTKLSNMDSKVYMKNSPFTSRDIQIYNSYSFYDVDINKEFNATVDRMEKIVQKEFPKGAPAEVLKALANYRKAIYESYLAESKARMTAPSQMVVGPAGYENFDRKRSRANAIRNKSYEDVKYAEKQIKLAIQRSNKKAEVNAVKTSYGVNIGDRVILYWTNNYRKFKVPAKVVTINAKSLVGELEEEVPGYYPKGWKITVPMYGTAGNRWSHIGKNAKEPETKKALADKYYESLKGKFKVGDRVYNKFYRFEGTVIKINKQTMVIKGEPTYNGDDGIRKVPIDESMTQKI